MDRAKGDILFPSGGEKRATLPSFCIITILKAPHFAPTSNNPALFKMSELTLHIVHGPHYSVRSYSVHYGIIIIIIILLLYYYYIIIVIVIVIVVVIILLLL